MSAPEMLDDCLLDPTPLLADAVEALLMATNIIPNYDGGSVKVVDRRRLMWLHRALQLHRGEPLTDYSAYARAPSAQGEGANGTA